MRAETLSGAPAKVVARMWSARLSLDRHVVLCLAALAATGSTAACSVLVDADRKQCEGTADCAALSGGQGDLMCIDSVCQDNPAWSCLAHPQPPPLSVSVSGTAVVEITVRGLVDDLPVTMASARLCRRLDLDCLEPLSPQYAPNPDGIFTLQVELGFDGYVEIIAPERVPGLYVFSPPVTSNRTIPWLPLLRPTELAQFATLGGRPLVEGRGHVMLGAYDCQLQAAPGVRLSSSDADQTTSPFYVVSKLPSWTASGTDVSGEGGLINLRPGPATVTGALGDGRQIGTLSVVVRPGSISYTTLIPMPR
jgi:hypothetical protein